MTSFTRARSSPSSTAHRRPGRRQARRRDRAAQPLAPPAAAGRTARGGAAQEHPDDRPDRRAARPRSRAGWPSSPRRRSSRSRRPSSPRSAMSAATSSRSPATSWRSRSSMTRERLRKDGRGEGRACRRGPRARRAGRRATPATRRAQKFRKMLRDGELDDREIEVEVPDSAAANLPTFEIPGMPGAQMGMINLGDMFGKAFGGRTKPKRKMTVAESYRRADGARRATSCSTRRRWCARRSQSVEQNGIVFLDEIDKISGRTERGGGWRRRCQPRGRAARPAAADRGHHGRDQARPGQDRPRPVHRLGRLPPRQALGPAARAAGPAADPGRAEGADRDDLRRILTEPEASLVKQYKALLATEGVELEFTPDAIDEIAAARPSRSTRRSRTSAPAGCTR